MNDLPARRRWYAGVSRSQWLVLAIASAGWVFDAFEGQIFNITRNQLLGDILKVASSDPAIQRFGDLFLGVFLAGGTVGGVFFGWLGDRFGRRPTMILTILMFQLQSFQRVLLVLGWPDIFQCADNVPLIMEHGPIGLEGFDDKVLSLYARGLSTRDIQGQLEELYGVEVSPTLISNVTDAVMDEVRAWQSRPLSAVYPILYFDALFVKTRQEGPVMTKAVYLALGINLEGVVKGSTRARKAWRRACAASAAGPRSARWGAETQAQRTTAAASARVRMVDDPLMGVPPKWAP